MKPIRVYISGPISGHADGNRPAFDKAAETLKADGYEVVNPHEVCTGLVNWEDAMRADIKALMDCTHIALLAGWERSRGAVIEARLAADLGMRRIDLFHGKHMHGGAA